MSQPAHSPAKQIELTSHIASAYLANDSIRTTEIAARVRTIHAALGAVGQPVSAIETRRQTPATSVRKSVTDEYLISLEDRRRYQTPSRHLKTLGLTPQSYREKWGLPYDYPMTSPTYMAQAIRIG